MGNPPLVGPSVMPSCLASCRGSSLAVPGNGVGMTDEGASEPGRAYWVLVDIATGREVPPHVKFTDPAEAVEYHLGALGGRPRYQLREGLASPAVDPNEPRAW
jgi:hypothetical protein